MAVKRGRKNSCDRNTEMSKISREFRHEILPEILKESNEKAFAILQSVGDIGHIPGGGNNFIPANAIMDFYGVSGDYLSGVLYRNELLQKNYPDDIIKVTGPQIFSRGDVPLAKCCVAMHAISMYAYRPVGSTGGPTVFLPKNGNFNLYSPRIVLALALVMHEVNKSGIPGNIEKVSLAIKRNYQSLFNKPRNGAVDGVLLNSDGNIVISMEFFSGLIKTAVREAVSGVMAELRTHESGVVDTSRTVSGGSPDFAMRTERDRQFKRKPTGKQMKRPDNWDDIMEKWHNCDITNAEACELAGMCETTFRKYAHGAKFANT